MSLANLALYLETQGHGTRGTNIFIDEAPSEATPGILLRQTGGDFETYYDGKLRRLEFQTIVRSLNYPTGEALARAVSLTLLIRQKAIGDAWFYCCEPRHESIPFGKASSGIKSFVVNNDATWRAL